MTAAAKVEVVAADTEVEWLASYLKERAQRKSLESEAAVSDYGRALDHGMAIAYQLAAQWLSEAIENDRS